MHGSGAVENKMFIDILKIRYMRLRLVLDMGIVQRKRQFRPMENSRAEVVRTEN